MTNDAEAQTERDVDQDGSPVEQVDADHAHTADRGATSSEEEAADRSAAEESSEERERVAEHYEHMSELGANVKGEGEIE